MFWAQDGHLLYVQSGALVLRSASGKPRCDVGQTMGSIDVRAAWPRRAENTRKLLKTYSST